MPNNPKAAENLINLRDRSLEDRKRIAKMGNIAGLEARRKRKLMRDVLEDKLDIIDAEGLTNQERVTLGLIKGAIDGRAENYKTILEVLGELGENNSNQTPSVSINIIDNSALEQALYDENRKEDE